jgi:von Willebrand factor type A domain
MNDVELTPGDVSALDSTQSVMSSSKRIVYEAARVATIDGWWVWALVILSLAIIVALCIYYYRRDTAELSRPVRASLVTLRVLTIAGLVFFFFDVTRRTERLMTRPSEVAILVDTSQSMSLPSTAELGAMPRADRVASIFGETKLLDDLSAKHRVSVYAFGQTNEPRLLQTTSVSPSDGKEDQGGGVDQASQSSRSGWAILGMVLILFGILTALASLAAGAATAHSVAGRLIMATTFLLPTGIGVLGGSSAVYSDRSLMELITGSSGPVAVEDDPGKSDNADSLPVRVENWTEAVAATGTQSRIGDAIREVLAIHDASTLAGIVVLTDGQSNGGGDPDAAISLARREGVALVPVGLGSDEAPVNVRVVDLEVPRRVYPGDKFAVSAVLQASGGKSIKVDVQLLDELDVDDTEGENQPLPTELIETKTVELSGDSKLQTIQFELEPESVGRRRLAIRVLPPAQDKNQLDDSQASRYEVVARKLKVLAIAGGPTREYLFFRNLMFRDKSVEIDVWLQTGREGISQDADKILTAMPATADELFLYDTIVMFDPDWMAIEAPALELMDRYLAQQAGGLVLVGGPVYHSQWLRRRTDPRVSKIAGFFPVTMSSGSPLATSGRQGGEQPWPMKLTAEARRADFLMIADDPAASLEAWQEFEGVYDYVATKDAKPGAKVYSYFSDPTTELSGSLPIFMASQFYGAGRVYFQASGEMWRLRGLDEDYLDTFYTKLVRWVSEGRLLRDSNRGILLVDTPRAMIGDSITVRAVLTNDQFEPLTEPEVTAKILTPGTGGGDGKIEDLVLRPLEGESRGGTYGGRFVVRAAGSYEIRLTLGDALDEQVLRQTVQVRLPTVELERPRRNDESLTKMASLTEGKYLAVDASVDNGEIVSRLMDVLQPQPQTTVLPGTPDVDFARRRNLTLMWLIAMLLTMEWVVRRLHRLA